MGSGLGCLDMEEQLPTEARDEHTKPARQSAPRPRTPKAAFAPPPGEAEPEMPTHHSATKGAPAVLFQPPTAEQPPPEPGRSSRANADGPTGPAAPAEVAASTGSDSAPSTPGEAGRTEPGTATAPTRTSGGKKTAAAKKTTAQRKTSAAKKTAAVAKSGDVEAPAKGTPRKTTPAKAAKTTPPAETTAASMTPATTTDKATPVGKSTPAARVPGGAPLSRTPAVAAPPAARELLAHPGYAPELLALAAVGGLGPHARAWAERIRATYPAATPDGLARLATRRFTRLSAVCGAASAAAGLLAPVAELAAVAWTQAALVLHLAAAYGQDPTHPDRAADLLVLTQVHSTDEVARAALAAARQAGDGDDQPVHRAAEAAWRLAAPLAAHTSGWFALRLAARLLPGAAVLAATAGDSAATERLAARALARYRAATSDGFTAS